MIRPDIEKLEKFRKMFEGQLAVKDIDILFQYIKELENERNEYIQEKEQLNRKIEFIRLESFRRINEITELKEELKKYIINKEESLKRYTEIEKGDSK